MLDTSPTTKFREATEADIPRLVELGAEFFAESEFPQFAEYSPGNFEHTLKIFVESPSERLYVFAPEGRQIEGFIAYSYSALYTVAPLAMLFLFYVSPKYRKGPAGRLLVNLAVKDARLSGATAFYAGAMAGIKGTRKTLANLYRRMGFDELDFWGRMVL